MKQKFQIKIFKIKETHFELKGKSFEDTVGIIIANHKKHIYASQDNPESFNIQFESGEIDNYKFASYCYNQPLEKHYWRFFLPDYIGQDQNFNITKFSYCLFIKFNKSIYCVIGGTGISVIRTYINTSFGIDVYSRLAKPTEDLVIEIKSRSIANNVSLQTTTYNYNQTVSDTIEFSEIPSVMKIIIRDELKIGFFKDFGLIGTQSILEIGSYFCLRKTISFNELLSLINQIDNLVTNTEPVDLSFFKKIENEEIIENLDGKLIDSIIQNVQNFSFQNRDKIKRNDIDIVHPSKLEKFYECDHYKIRLKNSRGSTDIVIDDRQNLYLKSIEHIYGRLENDFSDNNIKAEIYKNQIRGLKNEKEITFGTFLNHIVAEITVNQKKYFKIDKEWYLIKDIFLQKLSETASEYYLKHELKEKLIKPWPTNHDEGAYNLLHNSSSSFVLDKLLIDNIELCDILTLKDNQLYFIHVKDGFDVKLRDCYIQVVLASKRLSIDLRDQNGSNYFVPTLNKYNQKYPQNQIDITQLTNGISEGSIRIVFVLAYKSNSYQGSTAVEKIKKSNSNIAKYSIVNVVKEMSEDFEFKLLDISTMKDDS